MEVIVVGAGQAGLAVSLELTRQSVEHVVLERGRIADTWRTRRWDSFRLVTPNWMNPLPGQQAGPPDEFSGAGEFVDGLERYAAENSLPVRERTEVLACRRDRRGFTVETGSASLRARAVVVASGFQWRPRVPAMPLPDAVTGVHSGRYRNPSLLPAGAVVVVGSGQSGSQIALELARAGRGVYLCTSRVRRIPRRHRGSDMMAWWDRIGLFDQRIADLGDPGIARLAQPVFSGTEGGRSLSPYDLARAGVTLLGHLQNVQHGRLVLADDRDANVRYADEAAAGFRQQIDDHLAANGATAPPAEPDPSDEVCPLPDAPGQLDLAGHEVGTVLWCTGHLPETPWLDLPETTPGLHVIGRPWLTNRGSGILYGMPRDAARIVAGIVQRRSAAGGRSGGRSWMISPHEAGDILQDL